MKTNVVYLRPKRRDTGLKQRRDVTEIGEFDPLNANDRRRFVEVCRNAARKEIEEN